jgi:hypothetical protein
MGIVRIVVAAMVLAMLTGCQMFSPSKAQSPTGVVKKPAAKTTVAKKASTSSAPRGSNLDPKRPAAEQTSWWGALFKKKEEPKQPETMGTFLSGKRPESL